MAETTLLDGRVPTSQLLHSRTLGWGSSFPDRTVLTGELFLRTDEKTIYYYNGTDWTDMILEETLNINLILGLI